MQHHYIVYDTKKDCVVERTCSTLEQARMLARACRSAGREVVIMEKGLVKQGENDESRNIPRIKLDYSQIKKI